jgi:anti-anti-sigma factor
LSLQPAAVLTVGTAVPAFRPRAFESELERHCALGKEFTVPTASTVQLQQVHIPSADDIHRCGRAVFSAQNLDAARVLVGVLGDVDATNHQELGRFVARHARVSKQLILDLSRVDFFGSQGFAALYYVSVQCARRDVDWMIAGGRTVLRTLRICDPGGELPLAGDIAAAYARLDHIAKCRHATEAWAEG